MPDPRDTQTEEHLLLEDAAAQAWTAKEARRVEQEQETRRDYALDAAKHGLEQAREILGAYADRGDWRAVGDPPDDEPWEWQAAAEVDGLRFLVRGRDGFPPWGRASLYLLLRCPWSDRGTLAEHGEDDRQILIGGLADLGKALADPDEWAGFCPACHRLQAEEAAGQARPPSAEERLLEAFRSTVDDRINAALDGFLTTYLPDRV